MKILRLMLGKVPTYGILQGDIIHRLEGNPFREPSAGQPLTNLGTARLLAPCTPSKIIAVGRNYAAHAAEHQAEVPKKPLIFFKPPSAVIGPDRAILLPPQSQQVEHEAELVVVIGRSGRNITPEEAMSFVLGYTCGNDVTARDIQRADVQWTRGKGFDSFCPIGPWIETQLDPAGLEVTARVNGQVRQRGNTVQMVFNIATLISYISAVMTLEPGDIIMTGTPAGVSSLHAGDVVEVEIEGIGILSNPVECDY